MLLFLHGTTKRFPWLANVLLLTALVLAGVTATATLWRSPLPILPAAEEEFDPFLGGLSSVDEIMLVLDAAHPSATPLQKLDAADALLRRRFRHGYSYFQFDQNWSAAMLRPVWDDLASPVRPDDILRFRRAACSQQALVFLEIAGRLGFDRAAVRGPDHFLAGVRIDGQWWVYDANREVRARRYPYRWLKEGNPRLKDLYTPAIARQLLAGANTDRIGLGEVNAFPAPQALLLHQATDLFSRFGWLLFLALWACLRLTALVATARARSNRSELSPA